MKFPKGNCIETENRFMVAWGKGLEGELTVSWHEGSS